MLAGIVGINGDDFQTESIEITANEGRHAQEKSFLLGHLDHIFVSQNFDILDSGVIKGFVGTGSDHLPVYAELSFSGDDPQAWEGFDADEVWEAETPPQAKSCRCPPSGCP